MGSARQSEQEPKRRYDFPCFIRPTITPAPWKSHRQHLGRTADVYCLQVRVLASIERFYSRGRQLCKFIATKESLDQFRLLGDCPTAPPLVSLAAVFWMSRNAPQRNILLKNCSERQNLLEVAKTAKSCSKRQKLLKSCRAQSG